MKNAVASLIALLLIAPAAPATTLVALRSAKSVVLAADSKMTAFYGTSQPAPLAKIIRCGDYFVGAAGVRTLTIKDVRFNVKETITAACKPQQTPQQATQAIADAAKADYIKIYTALTSNDAEYTRSITSGTKSLMEADLLLVGIDRGIPFIATILLLPRLQDHTVLVESIVSLYNNKLQPGVCEYLLGGVYGDLWDFLSTYDSQLHADHLLADAGYLVDYQIGKTPDVSGYPINVLELTAAGAVNVKHCEAVCDWKQ
jgi:hypothetical protein